ncbi:AzlC family ABC transporter permease [Limnochorda pilosa]|uniref:Branched-chain amino acid ABC transporter permease n=1 Tax=Limnochorda pilosa TaxID=1555112 RepID=A0A0K2SM21_LIMPI|nr:AzlC family ABC transporter permease [Limnochorda pilosa]BAS28156.1 branched-chain amino acid ABC transporter permease [Limnochorda pilosa]
MNKALGLSYTRAMRARAGRPTEAQPVRPERSTARALAAARRFGLPVALGYVPVAAAYGLLARQSGLSTVEALFFSVWVYAGASQFLVVGMVAAGVTWPGWVLAGAFMNLRHALFAFSVAPGWKSWSLGRRAVASFGLTDEAYAVIASGGVPSGSFPEVAGLEATAYLSWVGGTLLGAWGSVAFPPALARPLEFALPALFLALLVPALRERPAAVAAVVGGGVSLGAASVGQASWGIVLGGLLGATAGGLAATGSEERRASRVLEGEPRVER